MPRPKGPLSKPSPANRFAKSPGTREDGQQLRLEDIMDLTELGPWLEEVISTGASVTLALTKSRKSLYLQFWIDGEQYPWYLANQDDWEAMVVTTSVEQT